VAPLGEVVQVKVAKFVGFHGGPLSMLRQGF
jgi:hypothetical protein